MASTDKESSNSSRWWEFYAVRYGMGTVVGAVVFFFLCNTNPVLRPMLFGAENGQLDAPLLTLLAGYGLAYCYIASAPILVAHAGRFLLSIGEGKKVSIQRLAVGLLPPFVATLLFFFTRDYSGATQFWFSFVFFLAFFVIWLQYLVVGITLLFRSEAFFQFYKNLAIKRADARTGLVESYRHLREHGNSFLIVVLEIILAIILFAAANFDSSVGGTVSSDKASYVLPYIGIILIWILPASLVWLVATVFERKLTEEL